MFAIVSLNKMNLLKNYLAHAFYGQDVLVIETDIECSEDIVRQSIWNDICDIVWNTAHIDLRQHFHPMDDYLILPMNKAAACAIVNQFDKGATRMYVFHGGECIHENY